MTPREIEEYKALRATIRERGTARVWIFVVGFALWVASVTATAGLASLPVATLLPLLLLAAIFESILALHTAVERVGRYLQVFYEGAADDEAMRNWEHTAMAFDSRHTVRGIDPLFAFFFIIAALCNCVPAILAGAVPIEWLVIGTAHLIFVIRVVVARQHAANQRALDLKEFERLRNEWGQTRGQTRGQTP
jgi:hypothetical protein